MEHRLPYWLMNQSTACLSPSSSEMCGSHPSALATDFRQFAGRSVPFRGVPLEGAGQADNAGHEAVRSCRRVRRGLVGIAEIQCLPY